MDYIRVILRPRTKSKFLLSQWQPAYLNTGHVGYKTRLGSKEKIATIELSYKLLEISSNMTSNETEGQKTIREETGGSEIYETYGTIMKKSI